MERIVNLQKQIIDQLPTTLVFVDTDYTILTVSSKLYSLLGIKNSDIITGKNLFEIIESLDIRPKADNVSVNYPNLEPIISSHSNSKHIEWSSKAWKNDQEKIIGFIFEAKDISNRIKDLEQIEKQKTLIKQITEIANIGHWEFNAFNEDITWCEKSREIFEVPKNFIPDLENSAYFYEESKREAYKSFIYKSIENNNFWSTKLCIQTAKGNKKWIIVSGKPVYDKTGFTGIIGTFQDVHNQTLLEKKTRNNEHLIKTLFDNLPINLFVKDENFRKVLVNKNECAFYGAKNPKELIGKDNFDLLKHEDAIISQKDDLYIKNSLKSIIDKEVTFANDNGKEKTLLVTKIPIVNSGKFKGIIGFSLDISKIKNQQKELRNLISITSEQNKKLLNFTHIVSHNLRSHTSNFTMLLGFLLEEKDEKEKECILNMLKDSSENLQETIKDLNEIIDINSKVNLDKKPICLNDKLSHVEQGLTMYIKEKKATIVNNIPKKTNVKAIPAYLESILMNFLTNGIKYRSLERDPIITLGVKKNKKYLVLSITDNGMGLDLEKHGDKLFGMYKTFHKNKDAKGIGLYITKNQIEAMKGKITVKSELGKGTTFNIYFNEEN